MAIGESVALAKAEIAEVFKKKDAPIELDEDTGCFMDVVGKCPKCGRDVLRYRFSYGCSGYKEGCDFKVNLSICKRNISLANVKMLLETGKTSKIQGFISKNGKPFSASLKLEDGKAVFDFE